MRLLGAVAHAENDVRRLERARGAGGTTRHRDALGVELQDHRLALDVGDGDADVAGQACARMTEVDGVLDRRQQARGQAVA